MRAIVAVTGLFLLAIGTHAVAQDSIPAELLQRIKQASVFIKVTLGPLEYSGSGFVIETDGQTAYLVTNAHVVAKPDLSREQLPLGVRGRDRIEIQRMLGAIEKLQPEVRAVFNSGTADEQILFTETLAIDSKRDLAILKVIKVRKPPVPIALDETFHPGETTPVLTFGFPFGESLANDKGNPAITVGRGAVSSIRLDERRDVVEIQIDGALNPGNSGGPVVDLKGRLVGVAVAGIRGSGIGFAIPPLVLHRMLAGTVSEAKISTQRNDQGVAVEITFELLDPFQKIRQARATCVLTDATASLPDASKALEGARVDLKIDAGKATGTWRPTDPITPTSAVQLQVSLIGADGVERRLPASQHRLSVAAAVNIRPPQAARARGPFSLLRGILDDERKTEILLALRQEDSNAVLQTLRELSRYAPTEGDTEIVSTLERLLSHKEESVRAASTSLIGRWGSKGNSTAVLKLLDDAASAVRHAAMETLGKWQTIEAIDPIVARLNDATDRGAARQSLMAMGERAEPAMLERLSATELAVRLAACEILGEIGTAKQAVPALKKLLELESGLLAARGKAAIERITSRSSNASTLLPAAISRTQRKVHLGPQAKQGSMLLSEGHLIIPDKGPAVGLGIVQTGDSTMEFTYLMLVRFPDGDHGRTTFATRKKPAKGRLRVIHTAILGDDEFSLEHAYTPDKLPFVEEEFVIHEQTYDPAHGRVFLIDLSGETPVVVQRNDELSAVTSLLSPSDEVIAELADQALHELTKSNRELLEFANGGKLPGTEN